MPQATLYEDLARHLDSNVIVGAPLTPSLLEILKILFPEEEAKIALKIPMQNKTLAELKEVLPGVEGLEEKTQPHGPAWNFVYFPKAGRRPGLASVALSGRLGRNPVLGRQGHSRGPETGPALAKVPRRGFRPGTGPRGTCP